MRVRRIVVLRVLGLERGANRCVKCISTPQSCAALQELVLGTRLKSLQVEDEDNDTLKCAMLGKSTHSLSSPSQVMVDEDAHEAADERDYLYERLRIAFRDRAAREWHLSNDSDWHGVEYEELRNVLSGCVLVTCTPSCLVPCVGEDGCCLSFGS